MAIDVGMAAINRTGAYGAGWTMINMGNPANAAGEITTVEIWANVKLLAVEVATFYQLEPTFFTTRDHQALADVNPGSKQTRSVNLDVEVGDFIGMYYGTGQVDVSPGDGTVCKREGNHIDCVNTDFGSYASDGFSLYGKGSPTINITAIATTGTSITSALSRGMTEALTSTINGIISITSKLSRTRHLTAISNFVSSLSANLNKGLAATISGVVSITSRLSRTRYLTAMTTLVSSITSRLSRTRYLDAVMNGITSIAGRLSRTRYITAVSVIVTSLTVGLSRGITEVLTSSINIGTSITSTLGRGVVEVLSTTSRVVSSMTNRFVSISGIHKEVKKPDTTYYEVK